MVVIRKVVFGARVDVLWQIECPQLISTQPLRKYSAKTHTHTLRKNTAKVIETEPFRLVLHIISITIIIIILPVLTQIRF